jgi:hypothetical protein
MAVFAVFASVRIQLSNVSENIGSSCVLEKETFFILIRSFLVGSPPRRTRKARLPNNPRRLRRKRKEVLEERLKRRFVVG